MDMDKDKSKRLYWLHLSITRRIKYKIELDDNIILKKYIWDTMLTFSAHTKIQYIDTTYNVYAKTISIQVGYKTIYI